MQVLIRSTQKFPHGNVRLDHMLIKTVFHNYQDLKLSGDEEGEGRGGTVTHQRTSKGVSHRDF